MAYSVSGAMTGGKRLEGNKKGDRSPYLLKIASKYLYFSVV
jgi:hypothetical protein